MRARSRLLPALALAALAGGCSKPVPRDWENGQWSVDQAAADRCRAMRALPVEWVAIDLGRGPLAPAVNIIAPAFAEVRRDRPYPEMVLTADGEPLPARAGGIETDDGRHGLAFLTNTRRLLRRHPRAARLVVLRDGREIYATDLGDTAEAFRALRACDHALLLGAPRR